MSRNNSRRLLINFYEQCHVNFETLKRSGERRLRTGPDVSASCVSDELATGLVVSPVQSASGTTTGTKISGFVVVGS